MVVSAFLLDGVVVIHHWEKWFWKYFHSQHVTEDTLFQYMTQIGQKLTKLCLNYFKTIYFVQQYVQSNILCIIIITFKKVYLILQYADKGSCHGDSGGPLVIEKKDLFPNRHVQIGIVTGAAACGDERLPSVYARVDHPDIWNFIYDTIQGNTTELTTEKKGSYTNISDLIQ